MIMNASKALCKTIPKKKNISKIQTPLLHELKINTLKKLISACKNWSSSLRLNFWGRFQRLFDAYQSTWKASTHVNFLASKPAKQFHINILCVSAKYADDGAEHGGRNCTFILRVLGIQLVSRSSKMKWKESKSSEAGNWFVALHWGKVGRISFSTYPKARRVRSQAIKAVAWAAERLSVPQTRTWWIPANTEASPTIEATSVACRK
jgi:hypothetical protein